MAEGVYGHRRPQSGTHARVAVADSGFAVPDVSSGLYRGPFKRTADVILGLLALPLVVPVILLLWLAVRRDGGAGFFAQERVGAGGRRFRCWKLRTMRTDAAEALRAHLAADPTAAAEWARDHKLRDDPRVTRLGSLLRRTSLDELPQIWNVLRGDMSFVGPRPIVPEEMDRYGRHVWAYLAGRPGITGLWQVSGRNGISYDERVALDVRYRLETSFLGDLSILLRTAGAVLGRTGC